MVTIASIYTSVTVSFSFHKLSVVSVVALSLLPVPPGGGGIPYEAIRDVTFLRVLFFSLNS